MRIEDLLDTDQLATEIDAGYVTERAHPEFPELRILNYTDRCQFDGHWTAVTRQTRGVIYNADTREVLARPFAKFYNYGDVANTGDLDLDAPILGACDKWDGSLGIRYQRPDGRYAIATRGSFASEQAEHATALLNDNPGAFVEPVAGETDLFEIIYPGNRIVLDYDGMDALVWLGTVENATGAFMPVVRESDPIVGTLRDVLALPDRENAEGWVVWLDHTRAVKIKQTDYLDLHRVVSHLTVKEVWRQLRAGTFEAFAEALPDEFHTWAVDTAGPLRQAFESTEARAHILLRQMPDYPDRKSQALWIQANAPVEYRGFLFGLLDGRDITDGIWKLIEPRGDA
jgi:RNA ligase